MKHGGLLGTPVPGALVLGALLLGAVPGCAPAPTTPRHVLLVSVDTLRADALGFAGHAAARTPRLDALAAGGTVFTEAVTPLPRTTPGLASLLTGTWPKTHGSRDVGDPIHGGVATLAEILSRRGFRTLAVSANASASAKQGLDRGFDDFVDYDALIARRDGDLYRDLTDVGPGRPGWAEATTDAALELLATASADRRFLLWVFYFDPHFFYRPPSPWQDGVDARRCWQLYEYFGAHRDEGGQLFSNVGGVAAPAREDCRRLYDAEVAYTDHQIGRLLDGVAASGLLADTLVVFTADHGENFGEGNLWYEHGDNVHDAGLRVPLVFSGPGVARGRRDSSSVSLVDVLPTLLARLGITGAGPRHEGRDLSRHLAPGPAPRPARRRPVFAESGTATWNEAVEHVTTGRTWWRVCVNDERWTLCEIPGERPGQFLLYDHRADPELLRDLAAERPEEVARLQPVWRRWPPESARQRAARTARFKLVELPRVEGGYRRVLYDLAADPGETRDVSAAFPREAEALGRALAAWTADIVPSGPRARDPELEQTLRSLGYVR
jgi:arylsulfatase A-like enzyme